MSRQPNKKLGMFFALLLLLIPSLSAYAQNTSPPVDCRQTGSYYEDYSRWNQYEKKHTGVDFGCSQGTPVFSPADGRVYAIYENWYGYGKDIWVDHGGVYLFYAHLLEVQVERGQDITAGQQIALTGQTGWDAAGRRTTTGPTHHWSCSNKPPEQFGYFYEHTQEVGSGWLDPYTCLSQAGVEIANYDPNVGGGIDPGPSSDGAAPLSISKPGDIIWDGLPSEPTFEESIVEKVFNITIPKSRETPFDTLRKFPTWWYGGLILLGFLLILMEKRWRPVWSTVTLITVLALAFVLFVPMEVQAMAESELGTLPQQMFNLEEEKIILPAPPTPSDSQNHVVATPVVSGSCDISPRFPDSIQQWCNLITSYSKERGLNPNLIAALILQESGGQPKAYSPSGAVGLMQVMPRDGIAASFMCRNGPCFTNRPSIIELEEPDFNVKYGTAMLANLISSNGSIREGLKLYGPMDVGYYYADKVLKIQESYSN